MNHLDIRELHTMEEFETVCRLYADIWGTEPGTGPISAEIMRALSHAGNYVAGAYENGRLTGASVAFFAEPAGTTLHSHITGAAMGRGIGLALKLHQRQWALDRGLKRITWTYDPLIRRNAHFNLTKLGARPEKYLESFYGAMDDAINGGDESDRVLTAWDLSAPCLAAERNGIPLPAGAAHAVRDRAGLPQPEPTDAEFVLIDLPDDIEALRRTDAAAAHAWRLAVRETLGTLLADGARVLGLHDRRSYVVHRTPASAHQPTGSNQ
ncbi:MULTISPECIES: GNAT family N-acetyltransferase [unclassified Streptomyces]|uniref:GNAT family N-acetyltransferase n=1 Tax=unclassified Streptomyces TaxID=2593676 RepID=UPI001370BA7A|nr:GNAT family N-acetyltransferase [Streptomyces sp. SID335]MYZ16270.1 GNAT family N-acetyltransferase [Streptomyces sp. SID337]NDZ90857.1 GNAT family N-acetyltransferase [Streptomyces sp. SID10115]NEA05293.1 GNAT family N-acetyltransferase [Streptomyces sp. SID10116]NEB49925.1 GNAT family N-acetyltransferase [Streptomyces sp. SID339]